MIVGIVIQGVNLKTANAYIFGTKRLVANVLGKLWRTQYKTNPLYLFPSTQIASQHFLKYRKQKKNDQN